MRHRGLPREMSNPSTNPFGRGPRPDLPSPRIVRWDGSLRWWLGLLVCVSSVLVLAHTAVAAEIVEVRVGHHPEFTRVVFELDRSAGYRIERSDPSSKVPELMVSLEASSIPRRIQSSKSLVTQVEIEPSGARSIARIRLSRGGLRLKEMILSNPPRIVIDVLSEEKPAPRVASVSKPATPKAKPAPAPPAPKAVPKAAPAPAPRAAEPSFDDGTGDFAAEAAREKMLAANAKPTVVAPLDPSASAALIVPAESVADEPSTLAPIEKPAPVEPESLANNDPVAEPAPSLQRSTRPMVVQSRSAKDEGSGWMSYALYGVGAIVLLLGAALVVRRINGRKEVNFEDDDADFDDDGIKKGNNPFGRLSADDQQMTLGSVDVTKGSGADTAGAGTTSVSFGGKQKAVGFGGSEEEKKMDDMEVISRDQVNESLGGMPQAMAVVPEEFQRMMREMNRRVESLESRIDELVDARDRLERQVAAQTEELRVQRAAIARTQRAVRNLARPEDGEGGDQEPTEPALRDPN